MRNLKAALGSFAVLAACYGAVLLSPHEKKEVAQVADPLSIQIAIGLLALLIVVAIIRHWKKSSHLPVYALLTPIVPLVLVLGCHWDIIPAFVAGTAYGVLSNWQHSSINTLTRSIIEGIAAVVPAVVLIIGLGILLNAVMHPKVASAMAPLLAQTIPTHALAYVITFTLIAPLALYRGPLNLWGMGSGLVKLVQESTKLGGQAIMCMLWSVGQIQGICDPANTQNLWVANYLQVDTQTILVKTLPYAWTLAIIGLCMGVLMGYVPF